MLLLIYATKENLFFLGLSVEDEFRSSVWWYGSRYFCIFCQCGEQTVAGVVVDFQYPLGSVQTPRLTDVTDARWMATNNVLFRAFPSHSNM